MRCNKLWIITAQTILHKGLPEGDLLILAPNVWTASKKANQWLKRNAYYHYRIKSINFYGEIDVF